ncbi:MAG: spore germination protein [Candidatus Pristimantibacillus lignocellulolyticus]|uniref:Spore germination protein n=1 Tax=Candidatus Pristimantibacillus lignocellulolyticus TaxID=2994561 RepID=A0A9J6ZCZ8_9BACL|nr:MAG: spore germination protein [Candidatus Pristimantibacillus lignocellulolyticus]
MWSSLISFIPSFSVFFQALMMLLIPQTFFFVTKVYRERVRIFEKNSQNHQTNENNSDENQDVPKIAGHLDNDLELLKVKIGHNSDVHFRDFNIKLLNRKATLIFVEGMQQSDFINKHILNPLMIEGYSQNIPYQVNIAKYVKEHLLPVIHVNEMDNIHTLSRMILYGYTGLLIDGMSTALLVGIPDAPSRSIEEPVSDALIRGPRVGFTEVLSENTALLRRHGLNDNLVINADYVGNKSQKTMVMAYMKDIANDELVSEIKDRITKLDFDYFAESGYVEQLMEDNIFSPFQQFQNTERPDKVIAALLEGRVAILLDGTPFALIAPASFMMLFQSPEDYYQRWISGTFTRILRIGVAFLSLFAPALYISFISFNPGLIPTQLAMSIIESRQGVPFSSILEVLILEISIEILRESGIRLPKPIGPAMGIVGGLVVGEAAVRAGLVTPFLVIVVALTAISSFTIPEYSLGISIRLLRFVAMFFAAILGLYGTIIFFLLLSTHLIHLRSFGLPYLSPIAPLQAGDNKDVLLRSPFKFMRDRPKSLKTKK